jgi:serine protease Do
MRLHLAMGTALMAALALSAAFAEPAAHPYLGIGVRDIDADSAKKFNRKEVNGAEVTSVAEDGPAAKAGLKAGDVVLEFNGQPVEGGEELSRMVRETPIGRQVRLVIWRNGAMQMLTVAIAARPAQSFTYNGPWTMTGPDGEQIQQLQDQLRNLQIPELRQLPDFPGFPMIPAGSPMLGIMGEALGQEKQLADYFGVEDGVLVKAVNRDSLAEKAGIKAGDVIVKIDETKVATSRDITMALRAARNKKTVTVTVMRNKKEMPITVTLENPAANGMGTPVKAEVRASRWV